MATQYALIGSGGEVQHVVSPGNDSDYIDGEIYNGLLAVAVGVDVDARSLIDSNYYADGQWHERPSRSSQWQDWVDFKWVFNAEKFQAHVRMLRNNLLGLSDWTQLPDANLTSAQKDSWAQYRQALRDLPSVYSDAQLIDDIIWPTKPE